MSSYQAHKTYVGVAKTMATWNHANAKLLTADVLASDPLIYHNFTEPKGVAEARADANDMVPNYHTTIYEPGKLTENYYLQTGRLLYPALGVCSTTEGTPNDHAITKRVAQTPIYSGRHSEQVNVDTGESHITDMFSMLLKSYHAECSERGTKATQTASWRYMKSLVDASCDTITRPTVLTDKIFSWNDFTFPIFTYGGDTIEARIIGWSFDVNNVIDWYGLSSGIFTVGEMHNYEDISVTLAIIPTGRSCRELIRTVIESYATDLDLTVKMARNATTDYVQFTHDKLYATPYDIIPGHIKGWKEGYFLTMHQLGGASLGSLAIEVKDKYNDNYYENP